MSASVSDFCASLNLQLSLELDDSIELPPHTLDAFGACYNKYRASIFNPKTQKTISFNYFSSKLSTPQEISLADIVDSVLNDAALCELTVEQLQEQIGYRHRWQAIKTIKAMVANKNKLIELFGSDYTKASELMPTYKAYV